MENILVEFEQSLIYIIDKIPFGSGEEGSPKTTLPAPNSGCVPIPIGLVNIGVNVVDVSEFRFDLQKKLTRVYY